MSLVPNFEINQETLSFQHFAVRLSESAFGVTWRLCVMNYSGQKTRS